MSASAVTLPTTLVGSGPRNSFAQNSGDSGDAVEGRNSFDHLIGGSKTAPAKGTTGPHQPARAGKDTAADATEKSGDADHDESVAGGDQQRVANGQRRSRDDDEASDASNGSRQPTDASTLLAWLQASTTHSPSAAGGATEAASKLGDGNDLARLAGRATLSITADATKPAADGLAALATTAGGDSESGALKAFHLPLLGAADGREPDKTAVAALDALMARDLAAAPQPAANSAAALAATAFAATTATTGQDRVSAQVTGLAALPLSLQAPLEAESQQLPQQIGERVQWLVGAGVQEARLQLHPRDLGSITVQVRMEAGSASVLFGAEHPAARAALQAALPQLREQFATGGMQLAQAQVSSQQSGGWSFGGSQTSGERGSARGNGRGHASGEGGDTPLGSVAARVVHIGLLDDYA